MVPTVSGVSVLMVTDYSIFSPHIALLTWLYVHINIPNLINGVLSIFMGISFLGFLDNEKQVSMIRQFYLYIMLKEVILNILFYKKIQENWYWKNVMKTWYSHVWVLIFQIMDATCHQWMCIDNVKYIWYKLIGYLKVISNYLNYFGQYLHFSFNHSQTRKDARSGKYSIKLCNRTTQWNIWPWINKRTIFREHSVLCNDWSINYW